MKNKLSFVSILASLILSVAICCALPVSFVAENDDSDSDLSEGYVVDDMILATLRNGVIDPAKLWPNATVYYKISSDFEPHHVDPIMAAMAGIEAVTCVRFHEADNSTEAYVNIAVGVSGCTAAVGYRGRAQKLNLQLNMPRCFKPPIIMHELLHTLGFYHQHMAPERDDYVTIYWENIQPGKEQFFMKLDNTTASDYGFEYDYESIMHYARKGFSTNDLDTIVPLDSTAEIGQRIGLSVKDIGKINAMYNCTVEGETNTTEMYIN